MALWVTQAAGTFTVTGADTATSTPATVTAGAANTKGSWTELVAATDRDTNVVYLNTRTPVFQASSSRAVLFDIGIGGAGSERVIVPNLVSGFNAGVVTHWVPVFIPGGSRIAVRAQSNPGSTAMAVSVYLTSSPAQPSWPRATDYGTLTASSGGTGIFTGTLTANTKSSWTEIVASTTAPIGYLHAMLQGPNSTAWTSLDGLVDIGVGGAGSEHVVISNMNYRASSADEISFSPHGGTYVSLPAGVRLAARWQTNGTNPSQAPRVSLIGVG